jgi:hypothetical protein
VLPGTHERGVLTDEQVHEISRRVDAVVCYAARGDVVAMRPLIIHASSKSATDDPRRVVHIEYSAWLDMGEGLQLICARTSR